MIEFVTNGTEGAKIKVIGVGGGGCNAINNMVNRGLNGVDLIALNTDKQALGFSKTELSVQIGKETTKGKGAGSLPEIGKKSAEESLDDIKEVLKDADMVFVTCGMGGGTGTGASPVVAKVAQDLNALVVGIVTTPFKWEGPKRATYATDGIAELRKYIDALIIIPNQKLIEATDKNMKFSEAYKEVDEILHNATKGIAEIVLNHGYVNVDFADVKTVMKGMGDALMGIGVAKGENRAIEATENALNSPLLDGISIKGAQSALINITAGNDLGFHEVDVVLSKLHEYAGEDVNIIHGVVIKDEPSEEFMVTVVATGFKQFAEEKQSTENSRTRKISTGNFTDMIKTINNGRETVGLKSDELYDRTKNFAHMTNGRRNIITASSPRGNDNLKALDVPSLERRHIKYGNGMNPPSFSSVAEQSSMQYETTIPKELPVEDHAKNQHNEMVKENLSSQKPAFLRRIMD